MKKERSGFRSDLTFEKIKTGERYRENVGKIRVDGSPTAPEQEALDDIVHVVGGPIGFTGYQ